MIPKFYENFLPMLEFLKDGKVHSMEEVEEYLAKNFNLTEEERNTLLPSGKQAVFKNRVGWARTYLYKAKLIDVPKRGSIVISRRGLEVLEEKPSVLDVKYLMQFPEFVEFHKSHKSDKEDKEPVESSPEEVISEKIEEINSVL